MKNAPRSQVSTQSRQGLFSLFARPCKLFARHYKLLARHWKLLARHCKALLAVLFILALGLWLFRHWQGPELAGYRVEFRPLVQTVVASGRVVTPSRVQVGSEITGVVLERRVSEGDRVAPGEVLAVLKADEFEARVREAKAALAQLERVTRPQARAALRQAQVQLELASRNVRRQRELIEQGSTSQVALDQAEEAQTVARVALERIQLEADALAPGSPSELLLQEQMAGARAALARSVIRSQVAGTVLTRNAEPGDLVQPGQVLFDIARDGATEILVPLDEEHLQVLQLGQPAQCVADAYPARPFPAMLSFIAPRVDPQQGAVEVRLTVDPVPDFLRQDMTVSMNLETGRRDRALVLANDALLRTGANQAEVLVVRDGKLHRQPVRLGLQSLSVTEVIEGLADGDLVLTDPTVALEIGERVRVTLEPLPTAASEHASSRESPFNFN